MIHVFHGFLGSPEDFSFLQGENVILHNLYELKEFPQISPEDILIGYSMGARIAMEIAHEHEFNLKKLVLINTNPGLDSIEEKQQRRKFELSVLNELKTKTQEEFLAYWNEYPIFFHDAPLLPLPEERFQKSAELFDRFALSKQENFLPELIQHKDKVLWIVGLFDEKYMEIATERIMPNQIPVRGIPGGHRLFQHPEELKKLLSHEGIL